MRTAWRSAVAAVTVVVLAGRVGQHEDHVHIARAVDGSVATVGAEVEAVRGLRARTSEVGVQALRDGLVATRDRVAVLHLDAAAEAAEPVR